MNKTVNNLTIYLLEKKLPFKHYLADDINIIHSKNLNKNSFKPTNQLKIESGKVIITEKNLAEPDWLGIINNVIAQKGDIDLEIRKEWSAIVFIRLEGYSNTIAITFGRMIGLLKEEIVVSDFGMVTAKQIVDSNHIKFINVQSFDEKQTRINKQSIKLLRESQIISPFELSTVKNFKGNASILNKKLEIGGRVGLNVKGKIDIQTELLDVLLEILNAYFQRSITEPKFKVLETISVVTDSRMLKKLDKHLQTKLGNLFIGKIDNNKTRKLSLVPDVDIAELKGFHITGIGMPTTILYEELDFLEIIKKIKIKLPTSPTKDEVMRKLKSMKINCKSTDSRNDYFVSFYQSLCLETTIFGAQYIFMGGLWYKLDEDFYQRITDVIKQIPTKSVLNYIDYDTSIHKDENKYNDDLIAKTNTIGLDCTKYKPPLEIFRKSNISSQSNIELADVLQQQGNNIQFIHIKKKTSAVQINHLFAQSKASAQLYINDQVNVQKFINEQIIEQSQIPIDFEKPYKLQVVLGVIISRKQKSIKDKKDTFTLLERISLYETIEILKNLGFEVFINFIDSNLK